MARRFSAAPLLMLVALGLGTPLIFRRPRSSTGRFSLDSSESIANRPRSIAASIVDAVAVAGGLRDDEEAHRTGRWIADLMARAGKDSDSASGRDQHVLAV